MTDQYCVPDEEIRTTMLNAMLNNQHAIAKALTVIAEWIDTQSDQDVSSRVRASLATMELNRDVLGACIGRMMNPE